jgi:hypothetical protein
MWPDCYGAGPPELAQCQIRCQIRGFEGSRGDRKYKVVSKLLIWLVPPAFESLPFHQIFPLFLKALASGSQHLLPDLPPEIRALSPRAGGRRFAGISPCAEPGCEGR